MSRAGSGSARGSLQAQQSRAMRCCGGSDGEAGLEVGGRSNSVPLPLYRTTAGIDSNLDC